jgi:hypothetical protein
MSFEVLIAVTMDSTVFWDGNVLAPSLSSESKPSSRQQPLLLDIVLVSSIHYPIPFDMAITFFSSTSFTAKHKKN